MKTIMKEVGQSKCLDLDFGVEIDEGERDLDYDLDFASIRFGF
jgi:hypothetical protein